MCAINGIVILNGVQDLNLEQKITAMQSATLHRGPDASGHKTFKRAAIGANKLAIVAPQDPAIVRSDDANRRFAILNGEIVNHRKLEQQIAGRNRGKSDGALIIPMIEKYGQDFIKKFAGMFSIAVYDAEQHSLQLWRDPLGVKPLYYYHAANLVIFSSEIKAIQMALDGTPDIDFAAVDHILRYGFNSGRNTVVAGIQKVLPGETVTFRGDEETHQRYWSLGTNSPTISSQVSIDGFRELFSTVISENAHCDSLGGFFTSGGLDSSMVTARGLSIPDSSYRRPISTKFKPHAVIDEKYAELLEKFLGTQFEWVEINDETARQTLEDIVPYLDEPLENPIHVGTYLMAERAKQLGIKSIITGDGSDEFFLGYERHANWFNNPDPVGNYPKLHWIMKPEEADELYTSEALSRIKAMVDGANKTIEPILNLGQALRYERAERLPEYHNMRLDRMTMAHGVEARVPFLDHRIVEYSLMVPTKTLFGKNGKDWLRRAAEPWLPKEILTRPKVLFPSLPDQWLSGKGSQWAAEILLDPSAGVSDWLRRDTLERYIGEHKTKVRQRGRLLWALTTLELWLTHQSSIKSKLRREL